MGKIFTTTIGRFDGGISTDEREPSSNKCNLVKHFDIFNSPYKLVPHRDTEADEHDGIGATGMKARDAYHPTLGLDGKLYALCANGSGYAEICSKANPTTGNWAVEATSASSAARVTGAFIEWQSNWYMFTSTNLVSYWTIGGTFTNNADTLGSTITSVANGVVGADGNMYMFYNNKVVRVASDGTTITDDVCTALPSDMRITSACRYGSYIAIGMAYGTLNTASPAGRSQVFIWDMVTTATVADVIDFGEGTLHILENIEGALVGVLDRHMEKSEGDDDLGIGQGAMVIKRWTGGIARTVKELVATQSVTFGRFLKDKVVKDNRLYWVASVPFGVSTSTTTTYNLGIYCFGRKDANSEFALSLDYIEDGIATTTDATFRIDSFGAAGNYWFINHSNDGSLEKTNDSATGYTTASVYESQKFDMGMDKGEFIGATILCETLPTAGQIVLKYKVDNGTSWSAAILTETTNSVERTQVINASAAIPQFQTIEWRIESTGGAVITGFSFKYEEIKSGIYN